MTHLDISGFKEQLLMRVENAAYWRREKAQEWPEDKRNAATADTLDALHEELVAVPLDDPILFELFELETELHDDPDALGQLIEEESLYIGRYGGFDFGTADSGDFLRGLLNLYYFEFAVTSDKRFLDNASTSLSNIRLLLNLVVADPVQQHLLRLLYVSVITTVETYLSDAFINTLLGNPDSIRNFVGKNPDFGKRELTLQKLYERLDMIEQEVKTYLLEIIWHNLAKVIAMYRTTFDIRMPQSSDLFRAIQVRHDLVHRNGKDKEGEEHTITKDKIIALSDEAERFITEIDQALPKSH